MTTQNWEEKYWDNEMFSDDQIGEIRGIVENIHSSYKEKIHTLGLKWSIDNDYGTEEIIEDLQKLTK